MNRLRSLNGWRRLWLVLALGSLLSAIILTVSLSLSRRSFAAEPLKVSVCGLLADPATFDHKLIEITGVVSRGFEDFTLSDAACTNRNRIWLELGGRLGLQVMYCCGVTVEPQRQTSLKIEGIETTIREDALLAEFQRLTMRRDGDGRAAVTLVGRYFSGREQQFPGGTFWVGYGHMGMASLLVIERVISVAER